MFGTAFAFARSPPDTWRKLAGTFGAYCMKYVGGCGCGALRYESDSAPSDCGYCHCRLCQKTSAAPALVFASFDVNKFRYSGGSPTIYRSSEHGTREFCSKCGTQVAYRDAQGAKMVDVNVGSLDDPTVVSPECHIWCQSQIAWFDTTDTLPRYQERKPDDNGT